MMMKNLIQATAGIGFCFFTALLNAPNQASANECLSCGGKGDDITQSHTHTASSTNGTFATIGKEAPTRINTAVAACFMLNALTHTCQEHNLDAQ